ncbi:MAG: hypothetical protein ACTS8W_02750 [Arsenophonus sp. NC-PY1-MAG3]
MDKERGVIASDFNRTAIICREGGGCLADQQSRKILPALPVIGYSS